jgi:hypothetical protein
MKLQNRPGKTLAFAGLSLLTGISLQAQSQATATPATASTASPPPANAGVINDWLRDQDPLFNHFDLGVQFRVRYVDQAYFAVPGAGSTAVDFRANTPVSNNDFVLFRTRFFAGYTPVDWLTIFGEGQNSSSAGDQRSPNPQVDGPVDLYQAYVRLGGTKEVPVSLKVGRQELIYGDERLVGAFDWDNVGRVFDAVKLRYEGDLGWVDAFASRVVIPNDDAFNQPNWYDVFSGVYGSTRSLVPKTELQLYFLADNVGAGSSQVVTTYGKGNSPRDIYTIGTRFQTLPGALHGWDFNGELAGQFGDFQYAKGTPGVVNGQRLEQLAGAAHIEGGYTIPNLDWKPRLAVGFDYATGDNNPRDNNHNTFVNLYPTNHKFYGAMDFYSWQNVIDPYFKATIAPVKGLSVALTYNVFWLATTSDFFYQVNQAPRTTGGYGLHPQNGSYAGQEIDLVATYTPFRFLQLQAGYGHYFTGDYINQTFEHLGGSHDADWVYVQAQFSF